MFIDVLRRKCLFMKMLKMLPSYVGDEEKIFKIIFFNVECLVEIMKS